MHRMKLENPRVEWFVAVDDANSCKILNVPGCKGH
jgi:hypothetical protein